jgi:hypothetical protein
MLLKLVCLWRLVSGKHLENKEQIIIPTPWPATMSELYVPTDRRLSAKLVITFADREV